MTTSIYKWPNGRLLVHEERTAESDYLASGLPLRIGQIRKVEKVLSIDTDYSKHGLVTNLEEVLMSGNTIHVVMRRGDTGVIYPLSGKAISGSPALGLMSGITSGLAWLGPLVSGTAISGKVEVHANVIGY